MVSPGISIAMATCNGARFLAEQLSSIAAQSLPPRELIITDDASTDDTIAIAEGFASAAPFPVRIERNPVRLGSPGNFERAVGLCSGHIIALSDQDDVWLPAKLATLQAAFDRRSGIGLAFSNAEVVDESLNPLGYDLWASVGFTGARRRRLDEGRADDLLLARSFVTGATMAFRAQYRDLILPFPADLPQFIHDRWAAVLIGAVGELAAVDAILMKYRQHPAQQIGAAPRGADLTRRGKLSAAVASYEEDLRAMRAIAARLEQRQAPATAQFVDALQTRIRHLEARLRLPESRLARLPIVAAELAGGRYARCSSGFLSAIKDMAR